MTWLIHASEIMTCFDLIDIPGGLFFFVLVDVVGALVAIVFPWEGAEMWVGRAEELLF